MGQDNSVKKLGRYDFTKATWGEKLFAWSRQDEIGRAMGDDIDAVFASIAKYDFTKDSKKPYHYLFWLCRFIAKDNIKPEDVYKIKENLEIFLRVQKKLPKDKQDISKIKSADELRTLVDPYRDVQVKSLGQLRREEREAILAETDFIYEGEHGKILSPKTERAAIFWGQGTQWCFSATETKNWFDHYSKKGPIIIYLTNDVGYRNVVQMVKNEETGKEEKQEIQVPYQVKFAGHSTHNITNINDKKVEGEIPLSFQNLLLQSDKVKFSINQGGVTPAHFPPKVFDEEFLLEGISKRTFELKDIRQEDKTYLICLTAVEISLHVSIIDSVPEDKRTEDLHIALVSRHQEGLLYIKREKITEQINIAAASNYGLILKNIPEDQRTDRVCLSAVTHSGLALQYVPKGQITEEMCIAAVSQIGSAFLYVPKDKYTEEVCLAAVKREGLNIIHVPSDKLTEEMCFESVSTSWASFSYVPENFRSERVKRATIKQTMRCTEGSHAERIINDFKIASSLTPREKRKIKLQKNKPIERVNYTPAYFY